MAQPDLGDERLEAVTALRRGPGVALILVNKMDVLWRPAQVTGAAFEIVLARRAGDIVAHLDERGLPHVDPGRAREMVRAES